MLKSNTFHGEWRICATDTLEGTKRVSPFFHCLECATSREVMVGIWHQDWPSAMVEIRDHNVKKNREILAALPFRTSVQDVEQVEVNTGYVHSFNNHGLWPIQMFSPRFRHDFSD